MPAREATILLVEDDEVDIKAFQRGLAKQKVCNPVKVARDGIEALEMLRGENGREKIGRPYIILLDLNMPRMNGPEFLMALRADPALADSVVFVLTTSVAEEDRSNAYARNVAGYITKQDAGNSFIAAIAMLEHYWKVVELPTEDGR